MGNPPTPPSIPLGPINRRPPASLETENSRDRIKKDRSCVSLLPLERIPIEMNRLRQGKAVFGSRGRCRCSVFKNAFEDIVHALIIVSSFLMTNPDGRVVVGHGRHIIINP